MALYVSTDGPVMNVTDEKALSKANVGDLTCICGTSEICATQPESFDALLSYKKMNFGERKSIEFFVNWTRSGLLPNDAKEVLEQYRAARNPTEEPEGLQTTTSPALFTMTGDSGEIVLPTFAAVASSTGHSQDKPWALEQRDLVAIALGSVCVILIAIFIGLMIRLSLEKHEESGEDVEGRTYSKEVFGKGSKENDDEEHHLKERKSGSKE
ncbi:hypothetical protein GCK32_003631 [Trichostrongylus colubriformis]|uniref:Uncharacterized protein n=1 Tax=Trichostrongylus colubriformis TaxID=6319 RepID=A0AAN8G419_TRICO